MEQNKYDIVLMDLHMPERNGFEATELFVNTLPFRCSDHCFYADVTSVDIEKCLIAGMTITGAKPVNDNYCTENIKCLKTTPA